MSRIKISVLINSSFLSWRMSIMSFFLFYVFLKEKGKGGIKPRNSSRSGFSRPRGGRGTYYRGVGSDPHAEGRGRGREEQRGRGSVNYGQRRSRGRRGNFVLLPLPLKSDLRPFFSALTPHPCLGMNLRESVAFLLWTLWPQCISESSFEYLKQATRF